MVKSISQANAMVAAANPSMWQGSLGFSLNLSSLKWPVAAEVEVPACLSVPQPEPGEARWPRGLEGSSA
jgi:hypothetical protein